MSNGSNPAMGAARDNGAAAPFLMSLGAGAVRVAVSYAIPIGVFLLLWDGWSLWYASPQLFPGPWQTGQTFVSLIEDGSLLRDSIASLARIVTGFVIGSGVGAILGLLIGTSRLIRDICEPYVNFLRFVAGVAWISIFIVWFGTGELSKIVLILYTTAFAVTLNTIAGVAAIAPNKLRVTRSFGAGRMRSFAAVIVPATVPHILGGMRLSLANAFLVIVAAEMVQADDGLGFVIIAARYYLAPDIVFCAMIALGCLGLLSDRLLMLTSRTLLSRYYRYN